MLDRHLIAKADLLAQGEHVTVVRTSEEEAELMAEKEMLERQVFGEYYEAYEVYNRSSAQRGVVASFSSGLPEPLEQTARESLVQILYEENARMEGELKRKSAGSDKDLLGSSSGQNDEIEKYYEQLRAKRASYSRALERTRSYLTPSQFEQFKKLLDNDLRQFQGAIESAKLENTG